MVFVRRTREADEPTPPHLYGPGQPGATPDQQLTGQVSVDEMVKPPKRNRSATYFRDSYQGEIECLKMKTRLVREAIKTLMQAELQENTKTREYIEKCYRLLYEQMTKKWNYVAPEKVEEELNKREMV